MVITKKYLKHLIENVLKKENTEFGIVKHDPRTEELDAIVYSLSSIQRSLNHLISLENKLAKGHGREESLKELNRLNDSISKILKFADEITLSK